MNFIPILFVIAFLFQLNLDSIIFFKESFEKAKIKALNENKLLVLFFLPDENDKVLQKINDNKEITNLLNNCINFLIIKDTKEWNYLSKLYNNDSSRAIILCEPNGEERDRIYSSYDFNNYETLIVNILNNKNTLQYYLNIYNSENYNLDVLYNIYIKYIDRGKNDLAIKYIKELVEKDKTEKYSISDYAFYILALNSLKSGETKYSEKFLKKYKDSKYLYIIYLALADYYLKNENYEKARDIYREYIKKFPDDLNSLNNFAYLSALLNKDLIQALSLIDKAIVLSKDNYSKSQYMDTKIDILMKLKRYEGALETIDIALQIVEDNELKNVLQKKKLEVMGILKK